MCHEQTGLSTLTVKFGIKEGKDIMSSRFEMQLPFSMKNRIGYWATRYTKEKLDIWADHYTKNQTGAQHLVEQYLINLKDTVRARKTRETPSGYLCYNELYDLVYWKLKSSRWIDQNTESFVKKVTGEAFSLDDDWEKLNKLTELKGVGESVASAILHLYDEAHYPILDKHALCSIGIDHNKVKYNAPFWQKYVDFCRAEAKQYSVSMRTLDRALWILSVVDLRENEELRRQSYPGGRKLGVTIDGKIQIRYGKDVDTFVDAIEIVIEKVGVERIKKLDIECRYVPLIDRNYYEDVQQEESGIYYIVTDSSSERKKSILEEIARRLNVDLIVDWME